MRGYLLFIFIFIISVPASAQSYILSGRVTDQNNKPVGFTSVYIRNSTYGTAANENGNYQFKLGAGTYDLVYRYVGYKEINEKITITDHDIKHDIQLTDEAYQIKQYSKTRGGVPDSAMGIIRQAIGKREVYLNQVKQYSCVVYIKGVQKLVGAPKAFMGPNVAEALSVDSTGKGILYQSESLSNYSFELPDKVKEEMIASKSAGQNTAFSYSKASDLAVNFYTNIFTVPGLSSHGFISPIGKDALKYYEYVLIGSKIENGILVHKIQVMPKKQYGPVFTGFIYITDGSWRLYAVDLQLTNKDNGLNLVDTLRVSQQYVPIRDSVWEPLTAQYSFKGDVLGFKFDGYFLSIYNNYNLNPVFPDHYFNGERMRVDSVENSRDTVYWASTRPVPLTKQEQKDYRTKQFRIELQQSIDKFNPDKEAHNHFNIIPYSVFAYKANYKNGADSLIIYPFNQTLFYNTVEGIGLNLKATYKHNYSDLRTYNITPNIRYGYSDKLFNANIRSEYTYDPLNRGKILFGFGTDLLDLNNVGTRSLYFNSLSTLLSEQNYVKFYRSEFIGGGYQHNIGMNLLWKADLSYANRTQLYNNSYYSIKTFEGRRFTSNNPLMPDAPATDRSLLFPQNQALTFTTSFTYTFDQQYETTPSGRNYDDSPYPQIRLNYRKGIPGVFSSDVNYNFASLEIFQEHLNTGISGYTAFKFVGGDFIYPKKLYFMDYNHFLGNQGTTFDPTPGGFHFLPFYTYSTDGPYFEGHLEHNFTGYLFNNVPLLRKLKLDEIVGVNYLTTNNNRNYSEFYVGVQRLIFRVDYGVSFEGKSRYLQGFRIFYGIR